MNPHLPRLLPLTAAALAGIWGCGGGQPAGQVGNRPRGDAPGAVHTAAAAAGPVRIGARPADACGWIPVAEVESLVGSLAGPPRPEGDACRYPLPLDSTAVLKLALLRDAVRQLLGSDAPALRHEGPDEAAVLVQVDLSGGILAEKAGAAMAEHFSALLDPSPPADQGPSSAGPPSQPAGWDHVGSLFGPGDGFTGRVGHVTISVTQATSISQPGTGVLNIPPEKWQALAARVRDGIPDLPFAPPPDPEFDSLARAVGLPQEAAPSGPDPCSVLTRAEAEAVLGKLLVAPYRSQDGSPYVDGSGTSCAYFTAGHHVLLVTPQWSGGRTTFSMARGVTGLIGTVVAKYGRDAETADTLEGPWDEAVQEFGGKLAFVQGDRLLQLGYLTSSTDAAGAVRVARAALGRLVATAPGR
jgi:hypothetical protein